MSIGSWGYYMQGNWGNRELETAGSTLSVRLDCPVHYPAFGKRLFECRCGVLFPRFVVDAALRTGDWSVVLKEHAEGYRPDDVVYKVGGVLNGW